MLALMFGALHVAFRNILGVEALLFSWALGCCSTAGLGCCSAVATLLGWPLTADTCHFWASRHCWAVTAHCGHRCGHRRCETGSNSLHQFVSRVRKASVLEVCTIKTVLFLVFVPGTPSGAATACAFARQPDLRALHRDHETRCLERRRGDARRGCRREFGPLTNRGRERSGLTDVTAVTA